MEFCFLAGSTNLKMSRFHFLTGSLLGCREKCLKTYGAQTASEFLLICEFGERYG